MIADLTAALNAAIAVGVVAAVLFVAAAGVSLLLAWQRGRWPR